MANIDAPTPPTIRGLFDPAFLESVQRLKLLARRVAAGGSPAEKRSRQQGAGLEFRDFRPYSSGDDIKAIDWNIYQRLGKVFLRQFEEQRDLPVYIANDISRSMFSGEAPRGHAGMRAAFALAAIALQEADSVGLFPFAEDLTTALRPTSGAGRLMRFAQALTDVTPGGSTNFSQAMRRLQAMRMRRGLLVVVSDFFDPGGIDAVVAALGQVQHRMMLVQLVRKSDADPRLDPRLSGELLLRDCESGEEQNVSATNQALESYRAAYENFTSGLLAFAKQRRAGHLRLDVEEDVVEQLARLFESGAYVV